MSQWRRRLQTRRAQERIPIAKQSPRQRPAREEPDQGGDEESGRGRPISRHRSASSLALEQLAVKREVEPPRSPASHSAALRRRGRPAQTAFGARRRATARSPVPPVPPRPPARPRNRFRRRGRSRRWSRGCGRRWEVCPTPAIPTRRWGTLRSGMGTERHARRGRAPRCRSRAAQDLHASGERRALGARQARLREGGDLGFARPRKCERSGDEEPRIGQLRQHAFPGASRSRSTPFRRSTAPTKSARGPSAGQPSSVAAASVSATGWKRSTETPTGM